MRYRPEPGPLRGQDPRDDVDAEIQAHLDMRAEALASEGLSPEDARAEALRRFGDVARARAAIATTVRRGERRGRWGAALDGLGQDVRLTLRGVWRAPGFAALWLMILSTATALGSLTFAVTNGVLLEPLPFPEPSALVALQSVAETGPFNAVSMANWVDWKERSASLAATALWRTDPVTVSGGDPFRVRGVTVLGDFWGALGARFVAGTPLTEAETQEGSRRVVVSESLWRRLFAAEPSVDLLALTLDGRVYGVAGAVADEHVFPEGAEVWIPARYFPGSGGMRNNINHEAIARLLPSVSVDEAAAELSGIARGIRETDPGALYSYGVGVIPLQERVVGEARRPVTLLMTGVLLVLLVASANLAGLAVVRARRRRDESAVRLALGAGRLRLLRQVATEHLVLATLGGAAGVFFAWIATDPLAAFLESRIPRSADVRIDGAVVAFAGVVIGVTALLTGAGPALVVLRERTAGVHAARGRIRGGRGMPGAPLVAGELALATALLIGGGLLARSFVAAASRPLGYEPGNVVTLDITLASATYRDARASAEYWTHLLERLRAHPGVDAAAAGNWIPTGGSGTSFVELEGGAQGDVGAGYRVVSDDYLAAMGMELVRGRSFAPTDDLGTERVGLVNRSLAERYWPGQQPLGRRIKATSMEAYYHGGEAPWITVIGVVEDVRHYGFETDPMPELFVLYRQVPDWTREMTAVVRTDPRARVSTSALRTAARGQDPALAIETNTLSARVSALLADRRLLLGILWLFAGLSLSLACLGVYALLSFAAEERRREMAIRTALGADRRGIATLMLRDAGRVILAGLLLGLTSGYLLAQLLESLLLDVSARDPFTYVSVAFLLSAVAAWAALLPSLRAGRADPLTALNS